MCKKKKIKKNPTADSGERERERRPNMLIKCNSNHINTSLHGFHFIEAFCWMGVQQALGFTGSTNDRPANARCWHERGGATALQRDRAWWRRRRGRPPSLSLISEPLPDKARLHHTQERISKTSHVHITPSFRLYLYIEITFELTPDLWVFRGSDIEPALNNSYRIWRL